MCKILVCGQNNRAELIHSINQLKQIVSAMFIHGQIAKPSMAVDQTLAIDWLAF